MYMRVSKTPFFSLKLKSTLYVSKTVPFTFQTAQYVFQRALCTFKRDLFIFKTALCTFKRALLIFKTAFMYAGLCSYLNAAAQNTVSLQKKTKGPYIYSKQPNLHSKQPNMYDKSLGNSPICMTSHLVYKWVMAHISFVTAQYVWQVTNSPICMTSHERYMCHDSFICAEVIHAYEWETRHTYEWESVGL